MSPEDTPDPSNPLYLKRQDHLKLGSFESRDSFSDDEVPHYDERGYFLGFRRPSKRAKVEGSPAKMLPPGAIGGVKFANPVRPISKRAQKRERRAKEQRGDQKETS